jgi:hypothetical protein
MPSSYTGYIYGLGMVHRGNRKRRKRAAEWLIKRQMSDKITEIYREPEEDIYVVLKGCSNFFEFL